MTRSMTETGLQVIGRDEFASERFDYRPGEHVVFGGPTQRGKTTLAFKLLEYTATPDLPAFIAVSKPTDKTTESEGKRLGFQTVREWPTPRRVSELWDGKPPGYLIWPRFGSSPNEDVARASRITSALIQDRYVAGIKKRAKGHGILVLDDTMVKSRILGLDSQMTTILAMSGAMGLGMWTFVQKPTDSGRTAIWSYGASEHVFITYDPDRNNQKRYDEIGGVDPQFVARTTRKLGQYQFLYIKRTGPFLCVVDGK